MSSMGLEGCPPAHPIPFPFFSVPRPPSILTPQSRSSANSQPLSQRFFLVPESWAPCVAREGPWLRRAEVRPPRGPGGHPPLQAARGGQRGHRPLRRRSRKRRRCAATRRQGQPKRGEGGGLVEIGISPPPPPSGVGPLIKMIITKGRLGTRDI